MAQLYYYLNIYLSHLLEILLNKIMNKNHKFLVYFHQVIIISFYIFNSIKIKLNYKNRKKCKVIIIHFYFVNLLNFSFIKLKMKIINLILSLAIYTKRKKLNKMMKNLA